MDIGVGQLPPGHSAEPELLNGAQLAVDRLPAPLSRFDEAIDAVFEAYDLDPLSPEIGNEIVWVSICCGQFAESADQGRRMISQYPEFVEAYWSLGLAESALGNHEAARRAFQAAEDLDPAIPHTIAWRGYVEGCAGNRDGAERCLARLNEMRNTCPVRSIHYSWVHSGMRNLERSLDYFERAVAEVDHPLRRCLSHVSQPSRASTLPPA